MPDKDEPVYCNNSDKQQHGKIVTLNKSISFSLELLASSINAKKVYASALKPQTNRHQSKFHPPQL